MVLVKVVKISTFLKSPQSAEELYRPFPHPEIHSSLFVCFYISLLLWYFQAYVNFNGDIFYTPPPSQFPLLLKSNMAASADLNSLISARPDDIVYLFIYSLIYSLLLFTDATSASFVIISIALILR